MVTLSALNVYVSIANLSFRIETEIQYEDSGVARMPKKLRTSKGDFCDSLPLKGKNLLSEGVNSFL